MHCYQINLQKGWGGGEVYTRFFSQALIASGVPTTLFVHVDNHHWQKHDISGLSVVPVRSLAEIKQLLPQGPAWILFHTPAKPNDLAALRQSGWRMSCIAHMPLYGRDPKVMAAYDLVIGVSQHVLDSLAQAGITAVHPEPLLGIADLERLALGMAKPAPVFAGSPFDWDTRKLRDRTFGWLYPIYQMLLPRREFVKRDGITLGVVSRLTPIKQFPLLFKYLAPVLSRHPEIKLEIFGAGGYASVRDLKAALVPIKSNVRFWGNQSDVGSVYRQIDYLLTGLPEKEALGLNVLEVQACGTPVLAVNSRPFTETVEAEVMGLFFTDPRLDAGADFERLLIQIKQRPFRIDPALAGPALARFSAGAFQERVARLCAVIEETEQ
jgi:glycosyltransferase involved in cell wall biosynthesis